MEIENNWGQSAFGSEKWIILSQVNAFGGKNATLGNWFIAVGSIAVFVMILLAVRKFIRPKGILYSHLNTLRRTNDQNF